jgi:hypothetical protein
MTDDTKACPLCGETIKAAARKCRFCRKFVDGSALPSGDTGRLASQSSRHKVYVGLGLAVVLAIIGATLAMMWPQRGTIVPGVTPGGAVVAELTLTTSDRADVNCLAATGSGDFRCGFSDQNVAWNGDEQKKLQPFYTHDRHLYLIPGLFLHPALQERFLAEPPDRSRDLLKRFTAKCNLKVAGTVGGVRVRWLPTGTWSNPEEIEVATVMDCKVDG